MWMARERNSRTQYVFEDPKGDDEDFTLTFKFHIVFKTNIMFLKETSTNSTSLQHLEFVPKTMKLMTSYCIFVELFPSKSFVTSYTTTTAVLFYIFPLHSSFKISRGVMNSQIL